MERILRMAEGFRQSDGGFTIASMGKIYAIAREQIGKAQSDATPDPTETEVAWAEVTRVADAILANLVSIRRYYGGEASLSGANAHASARHIIAIANKQLARKQAAKPRPDARTMELVEAVCEAWAAPGDGMLPGDGPLFVAVAALYRHVRGKAQR